MLKLKYTKGFFFDYAQYRVSDGNGNDVLLKVDYKNNNFTLESNGNNKDNNFENEIRKFAKDMLAKKHGVNFADKK
jgi:hypothetical protein